MPHSTGRLSASASSHLSLSSAAFITNIAESDFRHAQDENEMEDRSSRARPKRFALLTPKSVGAEQRPRARKRRECQRAEAHTRSSVSRKLKRRRCDLHTCTVPRQGP